jgi:fructose-bisphosphate aldolase class I
MRTRIITSPSFTSKRILGVILFEATMLSQIDSYGTAEFLWKVKGIPSFLKVDNGLLEVSQGVQLMKEIPEIENRLKLASEHGVIGTKMRSVIKLADPSGINACLDQQFELAGRILKADLIPIIEPEVDITSPEKAEAEKLLFVGIRDRLNQLSATSKVMLKLTLPEERNLYKELLDHPAVLRIAALSGGYSRDEANRRLAENDGLIASFSRALTEGLNVNQSDEEFNHQLDLSIESIYQASH